jgi:SAM-dependent methyltransferase
VLALAGVSTIQGMTMILVRRVLHAYVEGGAKGLVRTVYRRLSRSLERPSGSAVAVDRSTAVDGAALVGNKGVNGDKVVPAENPFDVKYGTDTGGLITGEKLSSGRWNDLWNTAYYGISASGFDPIFEALNLDWQRFIFVDLGSGKGRALLLASRFPFRRIIGVEIAPELSAVAAANIERFSAPWQTCREIEARTGDAAEFTYPAGPLVLYFNQPFLAPVVKRCLKNLSRSLAAEPREIYVVYVNPIFERLMERVPGLVRQWDRTFAHSAEDLRADMVGAKGDRVVAFRFMS